MIKIDDPILSEHVVSKKVEQEQVLLELRSGTYYGLNDSGSYIFELLKQGKSKAEIATALTDNYDISLDQAKSDIEDFLRELKNWSLICEKS